MCRDAGVAEKLFRGGLFHQLADIHDRDPVGDVAHYGQVVGHKQVGEGEPRLEVFEEVDDLRLYGDVKGGDGLVADNETRG